MIALVLAALLAADDHSSASAGVTATVEIVTSVGGVQPDGTFYGAPDALPAADSDGPYTMLIYE